MSVSPARVIMYLIQARVATFIGSYHRSLHLGTKGATRLLKLWVSDPLSGLVCAPKWNGGSNYKFVRASNEGRGTKHRGVRRVTSEKNKKNKCDIAHLSYIQCLQIRINCYFYVKKFLKKICLEIC